MYAGNSDRRQVWIDKSRPDYDVPPNSIYLGTSLKDLKYV